MKTKLILGVFLALLSAVAHSQSKTLKSKFVDTGSNSSKVGNNVVNSKKLVMIDQDVPLLIPHKKGEDFGYVNQNGEFVIQPQYHIVLFFGEDCNLLNSPNEKARKFGSSNYATVEKNKISYRIDMSGKTVYTYKDADIAPCKGKYSRQKFHAYKMNGKYGVIEDGVFVNPSDPRQYKIYPKYDYLFILEGDDSLKPMMVVSVNDKFGIVDIDNKIVIPIIYNDIKRNYSWKLGKLFEVTKDDVHYFYVDARNKSY